MARLPAPSVLLALLALGLPTGAAADVDEGLPRSLVTLQPLSLFDAAIELDYERALSSLVSFYVGPRLRLGVGAFDEAEGTSVLGVRGDVGVHIFAFGDAPEGIWAGPELGLGWTRARRDGVPTAQGLEVRLLGLVGLTWLVDDVFAVSVGGGAGVGRGIVDVEEVERDTTLSDVWALRLGLGFAF